MGISKSQIYQVLDRVLPDDVVYSSIVPPINMPDSFEEQYARYGLRFLFLPSKPVSTGLWCSPP